MENASNIPPKPALQKGKLGKILLFFVIIFGFLSTFASGYFIHDLFSKENSLNTRGKVEKLPIEKTAITADGGIPQETTKFLPGKEYFDDSVLLIAKDSPHIAIVATVSRMETDTGYSQGGRVSYFDGIAWVRKTETKTTPDTTLISGSLIKRWEHEVDPSRVLKEKLYGELVVDGHRITFSLPSIKNEISIRSLPGYTKFMSNSEGVITVDGKSYQAYGVYTKIYSLNAAEIQFYNQPFDVTTHWLAFWDTSGNFYHIDTTDVAQPTKIYKPHEIGIYEDSLGILAKTFDVSVSSDTENPPNKYSIRLGSPATKTLTLNRINSLNKVPGGDYQWFLGLVEGSVEGTQNTGIGIVEYINR